MTKQKFLLQGILLTAFSLFLRVTNIGYRSYLSAKIGAEGMGLYQLIFSVFMLAVTLSTSGISLAVTRMVTAAIAANRRETVRSVVTKCFLFCLTVSCTIAALLLVFSDFAAAAILGYKGAAGSLRILALGLPFMSLCTCMKGYFLSVDESLSTAMSDAVEQVLTILAAVALFWYFAPQSIEAACLAAMLASTFGEAVSFLSGWIAYRRSLRRNTPKTVEPGRGVLHGMFHIAVPCTLSSAARSLLSTGENLLIPRELRRYGLSEAQSMAAYGLLQGMAMPMLYFPSSFLSSFASLLIPGSRGNSSRSTAAPWRTSRKRRSAPHCSSACSAPRSSSSSARTGARRFTAAPKPAATCASSRRSCRFCTSTSLWTVSSKGSTSSSTP